MDLDLTMTTIPKHWSKWLSHVHEDEGLNLTTHIYVNTDATCGFLDKSDTICVFVTNTGALTALIERVNKKDFRYFNRIKLMWLARRVSKDPGYGIESYVNTKGDYYEFQYYKRWWYDLNKSVHTIDHLDGNSDAGSSG